LYKYICKADDLSVSERSCLFKLSRMKHQQLDL